MTKCLFFIFVLASFDLFSQISLGGFGQTGNERFQRTSGERYLMNSSIKTNLGFGIEFDIHRENKGLWRTTISKTKVDVFYEIEQFSLNSSFAKSGNHSFYRYVFTIEHLWRINENKRLQLLLGPGLGVSYLDMISSRGEGFDTKLIEYVTVSGDTILAPGPVYYSFNSRNSDALYHGSIQVNLTLQIKYELRNHISLLLNSTGLFGVSPIIRDERLESTANVGWLMGIGLLFEID